MLLSLVATIYRSDAFIVELIQQLKKEASNIGVDDYEIVLVDDNSPDSSWKIIQEESKKDPRVKGIKLSRNFGQQIAMSAGIIQATGDYVVIMDGDLQNPVNEIGNILQGLKTHDIVYCVSKGRNNWMSEFTSQLFWFILIHLLKVKILKNQIMMRGMTKSFVEKFKAYPELIRTIAGITNDIGMKHEVLTVKNLKRTHGKSNYHFFQRFHLMVDMIISLTNTPLNYLINISLLVFIFTTVFSVFQLFRYLFLDISPGYTSLVLLISFFGSLIVLILGIIGRYLSNIYTEVRRRPLFQISERVGGLVD